MFDLDEVGFLRLVSPKNPIIEVRFIYQVFLPHFGKDSLRPHHVPNLPFCYR